MVTYNKEKYKFTELKESQKEVYQPSKDRLGSTDVKDKISVFTEFGKLKSVVLGYMNDTSRIQVDMTNFKGEFFKENVPLPDIVVKTNNVNQEKLAEIFEKRGIHVIRPGEFNFNQEIEIQGFKTTHFHAFNPRDIILFYHDSVYETPTFHASRQYEYVIFNWFNNQFLEKGNRWYTSYKGLAPFEEPIRKAQGYNGDEKIDPDIPYFDAANLIRLGLDIVFLISFSGNDKSYYMFREFMEKRYNGKVRVHPTDCNSKSVHIDTSITAVGYNKKLGKYLVVVNEKKVNPRNVPAIFRGKNWVVMESPKYTDKPALDGYAICSPDELGNNFFLIDSHTAVVEEREIELIEYLKFYDIEVIIHPNPYGRESAGGFHCMTNDYSREEDMDFAKVLETEDESKLTKEEKAGLFDPELLEFLKSKGDIADWTQICNENNIFATYCYDHLSDDKRKDLQEKHKKQQMNN